MIAWLVAGQGAEHAGMGLEVAQLYPPAAELWHAASEAAGKDLLRLSETAGRALLRTEYLQPALTAVALGAASFLRNEGIEPAIVLGHSAGEVAALAIAGHMGFEAACDLSAKRGRAMSYAARAHPGGMATVRGTDAKLRAALERGSRAGAIFRAGQTTSDTFLVAGERAALQAAASSDGVSLLPVSGPWHSPLMEPAAAELQPHFKALIGDAYGTSAWVSNEIAQRGPGEAAGAIELLMAQLTKPMKLHQSIQFLLREGVTDLVVLGPHHALSYIVKRHLGVGPAVKVHGASSMVELRSVSRELS